MDDRDLFEERILEELRCLHAKEEMLCAILKDVREKRQSKEDK